MERLSKTQIETLYKFTRKHFVEFYDVQTELVDHLANGIETQWEENANVTFEEALTREFKKFGVFGFSEIVEQRTKVLEKRYRKEVFKNLKAYFKLPKIIITIFSIWALFQILQYFKEKQTLVVLLIACVLVFCFSYYLYETKKIKRNQKQTGKKWLFESVNSQLGGFIHLLNIGIYMPIINFDKEWDLLVLLFFSICIVMYSLLFYVSIHVVSPKLRTKFSKENPEYKLV